MQEDDDDFGELYTDVLSPFKSSPSLSVHNGVSVDDDRKEKSDFNGGGSDSRQELNRVGLDEPARVLEIGGVCNLPENRVLGFDDPNAVDESLINVVEENDGGEVVIGDTVIAGFGGDNGDWDDSDSDSDSDDGLQILLNNDNAGQIGDGKEIDEIGNVVDVVDEAVERRRTEGLEWDEDIGMGYGGFNVRYEEGERKELGDGSMKVNEVVQPPNIGVGYSDQFHSQFKYMSPGPAPLGGLVRPPLFLGPSPGHGRGDYRPAGLKNAPLRTDHVMPVWANNTPGHGFGRGLGFTLPSHKTVFEVDIDSFEEKPWRLPGVDMSDFFNFGLNEDTWKNYCKQLEQLRAQATMKSKIQVYESGRTEQIYDPDMPPELAAATGIHDISDYKTNLGKAKIVHTDVAKGSMGARPQLQIGRAIQVETGSGERLPSIDTRPPRIRDSDAIIEIVLKDSVDDDTVNGNDITELPEDNSREGLRGHHDNKEDNAQQDSGNSETAAEAYNDQKRELMGRKTPLDKPFHGRMIGESNSRNSHVMLDAPIQNPSSPAENNPVYTGPYQDERDTEGRVDRSPSNGHSGSTSDKRRVCNQKDEPAENVEFKHSPHSLAYHTRGSTGEQYFEEEDAIHDDQSDGSFNLDRVDVDLNMEDTYKDENLTQYLKKQKKKLQNELPLEDVDDREGSKAARSSDNSKAISGSTSNNRNLPYGTEEEVFQDGRSMRMRISKVNEGDCRARSKGRDERQDMDRHHMITKGREDIRHRKKWDPNPSHPTHHSHLKSDVTYRMKESYNIGGSWLRKDEESHGRTRFDNPRKSLHSNEMGLRHQRKVRETDRNDLDQHILRKQLDHGNRRGSYHDRFVGSRHWDRADNSKSRTDYFDDLHGKRRKDDIHLKRDLSEKEEFPHVRRESASRQNRERDVMEQRKRDDDIARIRNNDQQSMMNKGGIRFPREIADRQRDDWQRLKRSHKEIQSKTERADVRGVKTGRTGEEKSRSSHSRVMNELKASDREYHLKDPGYHSEQHKRKDKVDTENLLRRRVNEDIYSRETRPRNDERRSRQERPNAVDDCAVASEHHRMPEKKYEEYLRKSKESEEDYNFVVPSKIKRDDHYSQISKQVKMKGMIEQGSGDQVIRVSHQSSIKRKNVPSSDDERHEFMRGRSKLERRTSHKESDVNALTKPSSLNVKDTDECKKIGTLAANKVPEESLWPAETGQNPHSLASKRDADDQLNKDGEVKPEEDNHLDGVAKLKKRSEQLKLPMPGEKEVGAVKKMENEELPPVQTDPMELETKQE